MTITFYVFLFRMLSHCLNSFMLLEMTGLCVRAYPFGLAQLSPSFCVIRRTLHNSVLLNGAGQCLPIVTVDVSCFSCRT